MVLADDRGDRLGILAHARKLVDNEFTGVELVSVLDLFLGQAPQAGHFAVIVVRMGRAVAGNAPAGLGPAGGVGGMRVHNTSNLIKLLVEPGVGGRVGGRVHSTLHLIAVKVDDDHILRLKIFIGNAAGLDDKDFLLSVDAAYVAPGKCDQAVLGKQHVGLIDFLFQFFQHLMASFSTARHFL